MKKAAFFISLIVLLLPCTGMAASNELSVNASSSMIIGNFDVKSERDLRYLRYGIEFRYYDKTDKEFKIIDGKFTVGSSSFYPGLECELGFKGFLGDAERGAVDGSISGVGFYGSAAYTLPEMSTPVPVEFFGAITYAPSPLSFQDLDNYTEFKLGVAFYVVEQAAVIVDYRHHIIDMDNSAGNWEIDKGSITFGVKLSW